LYTPALGNTDPEGFTGDVPVLQEPRAIWTNAVDSYRPMVYNDYGRSVRAHDKASTGYRTTIWRWRKEFQNDFAARMDWSIKPYEGANHPPVVKLGHGDRLTVKSGEGFMMSAAGSSDPDGDSLSYLWFQYPEAGSYKKEIKLGYAENHHTVWGQAPVVSKAETAHFIVQVTDKGSPALTRHRRVIVTFTTRDGACRRHLHGSFKTSWNPTWTETARKCWCSAAFKKRYGSLPTIHWI
jgi:cellulose-binding protein